MRTWLLLMSEGEEMKSEEPKEDATSASAGKGLINILL